MTQRILHLAAYDVSDPRRLRGALKVLRGYARGRQKSVFECPLTPAERRQLLAEIGDVIDPDEDRFFLIRLDPRAHIQSRGVADVPGDPSCLYLG